ncbi:hypothetical protein HZA75_03070 [Candidatus Roizmanbacteria bacterium]|nr:hypothetical protein [Candidatus Roizmanbacteria bacterium]
MVRRRANTTNENTFGEKIDFIIQLFQKKIDRQAESLTTLHTKVNYMLAFASLLVVGYLTVLFDNKIDFSCAPFFKYLSMVGFLGLVACVILLLIAVWNRQFIDPPDPETIYSTSAFEAELDNLKNQVASDMKKSFNDNLPQLVSIAKWLKYAMWVFILSLLIIVSTAIFLPMCAKIGNMENKSSNSAASPSQQPRPVPPSQSPGTSVSKSPSAPTPQVPVSPSASSGTALPFSEGFIKTIK